MIAVMMGFRNLGLNLFSLYNPKSEQLQKDINDVRQILQGRFDQFLQLNDGHIREVIQNESDYLVLAWGMPKKFNLSVYYNQVFKVLKWIKENEKDNIYVFK